RARRGGRRRARRRSFCSSDPHRVPRTAGFRGGYVRRDDADQRRHYRRGAGRLMDWLVEPFSHLFMQRALLAGLLAAVATALVGTWVVLRGLTFMGDALAHGVLPGIALGVLLGFDLTLGAAASALVMILGINVVHRHA